MWPLQTQLSIELSKPEREGFSLPSSKKTFLSTKTPYKRTHSLKLPELSELDVVRHFTRLSHLNYSIDGGFYPLGSCTMKYNPRINEAIAGQSDFTQLHPRAPEHLAQGALEVMFRLENALSEIAGFARVSLQPAAGAQGEYAGVRMIRAYLDHHKLALNKILIPDSAHGTNPATAAMCGFEVVQIRSGADGRLNLDQIRKEISAGGVAGIMLTNPNTVGLFEKDIKQVCEWIHAAKGLVYCDGANMNAMMGITRPGDAGVDVMHFNLHKTMTTPHGGGGPGCGGIGVSKTLIPYLPLPTIERENSGDQSHFVLSYERPQSIGKIKNDYGHFLMMLRAYTYVRELGPEGVRQVGIDAILNANYIRKRLQDCYEIAYDGPCMHEVVFQDKRQNKFGVKTLDIAKRLIDLGFHPPTIYFPLLVPGALMIEPTETENLETIEAFCQAMIQIARECEDPQLREKAFSPKNPQTVPVSRVNEVKAVKDLILSWHDRVKK